MKRWLMVLGMIACCTLFASQALSNPVPWEYRVNRDTTGAQQEPSATTFNWNRKYVGWKDWRTGIPQCWYAYSFSIVQDTWPNNVQMVEPTYTAHTNPCLAVNETGVLYYAMAGFDSAAPPSDIFVFTATDTGLHFGPPVLATPGTPNTFEARPWIAARGDTVYLTYHSFRGRDEWPYRNGDIYFTRSTDRGQSFLPPIRVNDNPQDTTGRGAPTVAVASGGLIYVVWSMDMRNAPEVGIYCATSTDGGRTFGPNHRVTSTIWLRDMPWRTGPLAISAADCDSAFVHVFWADQRDTMPRDTSTDIWYSRSTDRGFTFSNPRLMSAPYRDNFLPTVYADTRNYVYALWYEEIRADTFRLVHSTSANRGNTFYGPYRVGSRPFVPKLGGPSGNSMGEYISSSGEVPSALFWTDSRGTSQDIYFSKGDYGYGVEESGANEALPENIRLEPSVPNPTKEGTLLAFCLPRPAIASLCLYDVSGRRVKILTQGPQEAGYHVIRWDGDDEAGHPVSSGIYLYRLSTGEFTKTRTMVVVR